MKGKILAIPENDKKGIIVDAESNRYKFTIDAFKIEGGARSGQSVDFDVENGEAVDIYADSSISTTTTLGSAPAAKGGMSSTKFLVIYLSVMVTTYIWRFAFIGASLEDGADIDAAGNAMNFLMFISYAGMAWVTYARGKAVGKNYLVAFPIVGAVFDLILVFIPLVPTVMNIITIVIGMPDTRPEPKTSGVEVS